MARLVDSSVCAWAASMSAWAFCSKVSDGVGTGGEPQRWLVQGGELDQRVGELGGVAALLAVHRLPAGDGRPRFVSA